MPTSLRKLLPEGVGKKRRPIEGIRARLGLSMALSLLPFIIVGLIQVRSEYQQQTAELKYDLVVAADRSIREAESAFDRVGTLLNIIAPEGKAFDCNRRLLSLTEQVGEISELYRTDTSGGTLCASHPDKSAAYNPENAAWFEAMRQGQLSSYIFLHTDDEGSHLVVTRRASKPLGDFDGVLMAVLPTTVFRLDEEDAPLPDGTRISLFDDNGRALMDSDGLQTGTQLPHIRDWLRGTNVTADGILRHRDEDGVNRMYAASKLANQNVYAVISAPSTSPWIWARNNPIRFLMLPLAAWLTAFAAAMLASERIVIRWLDYLDRIAAIYARGRYTVRPVQAENAPLEIRHLAMTMDELAENITRRDAALTEALQEKDALLREIHHRVKNNLQIISSLLSMQQRAVDDPAARAALGDTRQRIAALALIYRTLYQGEDVRQADAKTFLNELVGHLIASESLRGPMVQSSIESDDLFIDPEKLAPMALWLVEAVTNAQKHAFAGRGGYLKVRFKVNGKTSILDVEDDGPGIGDAATGVGVTLMSAFAKQLRGTVTTRPSPTGGTIATLEFETPSNDGPAKHAPA